MFSIECVHVKLSVEVIYHNKNLVIGHLAKWKLWSEVDGSLYISEKTLTLKEIFSGALLLFETNRGHSKLELVLSSKLQ